MENLNTKELEKLYKVDLSNWKRDKRDKRKYAKSMSSITKWLMENEGIELDIPKFLEINGFNPLNNTIITNLIRGLKTLARNQNAELEVVRENVVKYNDGVLEKVLESLKRNILIKINAPIYLSEYFDAFKFKPNENTKNFILRKLQAHARDNGGYLILSDGDLIIFVNKRKLPVPTPLDIIIDKYAIKEFLALKKNILSNPYVKFDIMQFIEKQNFNISNTNMFGYLVGDLKSYAKREGGHIEILDEGMVMYVPAAENKVNLRKTDNINLRDEIDMSTTVRKESVLAKYFKPSSDIIRNVDEDAVELNKIEDTTSNEVQNIDTSETLVDDVKLLPDEIVDVIETSLKESVPKIDIYKPATPKTIAYEVNAISRDIINSLNAVGVRAELKYYPTDSETGQFTIQILTATDTIRLSLNIFKLIKDDNYKVESAVVERNVISDNENGIFKYNDLGEIQKLATSIMQDVISQDISFETRDEKDELKMLSILAVDKLHDAGIPAKIVDKYTMNENEVAIEIGEDEDTSIIIIKSHDTTTDDNEIKSSEELIQLEEDASNQLDMEEKEAEESKDFESAVEELKSETDENFFTEVSAIKDDLLDNQLNSKIYFTERRILELEILNAKNKLTLLNSETIIPNQARYKKALLNLDIQKNEMIEPDTEHILNSKNDYEPNIVLAIDNLILNAQTLNNVLPSVTNVYKMNAHVGNKIGFSVEVNVKYGNKFDYVTVLMIGDIVLTRINLNHMISLITDIYKTNASDINEIKLTLKMNIIK